MLITRGPLGMYLFQDGLEPKSFSTSARAVYDVTGAGDTVAAAVALGLASGAALESCIQLANVAAGVAVGKFGTAVVTVDELLRELA